VVELEFTLSAVRREGLLLEVARIFGAYGFTTLKQKLGESDGASTLVATVRGPDERLPELQEQLAGSSLIGTFEFARVDASAGARSAPVAAPPSAAAAKPPAPRRAVDVERELQQLAAEFPSVLPRLLAIERALPDEQRATTMHAIGRRLGVWVFKRDFALGGRLPLAPSIKRIGVPALKAITNADVDGNELRIVASPFGGVGRAEVPRCHFFRGYLEGVLAECGEGRPVISHETRCRGMGHECCTFTING
jgi:predicted hydrocarbon binding protein